MVFSPGNITILHAIILGLLYSFNVNIIEYVTDACYIYKLVSSSTKFVFEQKYCLATTLGLNGALSIYGIMRLLVCAFLVSALFLCVAECVVYSWFWSVDPLEQRSLSNHTSSRKGKHILKGVNRK